jgi:methyl-accepting chemotaxis protein
LKKLSLNKKLIGGFTVVAIITLMVGIVGWNGISNYRTASQHLSYMQDMERELTQREVDHLKWAMNVGKFQGDESIHALDVEKDEHKCGFGKWYYGDDRKNIEKSIPEISGLLAQIEEPHKKLHNSALELENILKKGKSRTEALDFYHSQTNHYLENVRTLLGEIRSKLRQKVETVTAEAKSDASNAIFVSIAGMIIGTLFAVAVGIFLSFSITRPINLVIEGLTAGSDQVASASSQVASASQSLAEGASEQASSLEEASSSLEEMASMTRQNAENAKQANILASDASTAADKGAAAMESMSQAMEKIKKSSDETAKIIKVIDEIAFQTNLLALNAAVEAARAGEAGKGFAVVAEEVRNLSQRSAEAAKNTSSLIDDSQKNADNGVRATKEFMSILGEINSSIKKVSSLITEVTAASDEQSQGISQVNSAVGEMDRVTQQNAANAEESSSASEEMAAQAQQMLELVGNLIATVNGSNNRRYFHSQTDASKYQADYDFGKKTTTISRKVKTNNLMKKHSEKMRQFSNGGKKSILNF